MKLKVESGWWSVAGRYRVCFYTPALWLAGIYRHDSHILTLSSCFTFALFIHLVSFISCLYTFYMKIELRWTYFFYCVYIYICVCVCVCLYIYSHGVKNHTTMTVPTMAPEGGFIYKQVYRCAGAVCALFLGPCAGCPCSCSVVAVRSHAAIWRRKEKGERR